MSEVKKLGSYKTAVSCLEGPMLKMCRELKAEFACGKYGLIVGDDTSGRLPTLVMKGVADSVYDLKGLKRGATVFVQSARLMQDSRLRRQFKERVSPWKANLGGGSKVLWVTEYIFTGGTFFRMKGLFTHYDLAFDVACVASSLYIQDHCTRQGLVDTRFYYGTISEFAPAVHDSGLSGLRRDYDTYRYRPDYARRSEVIEARQDVKTLVDIIMRKLDFSCPG